MKQILKFNQTIRTRMLLNFISVTGSAMVMPYTVVFFSNKIGVFLTTVTITLVGIFSLLGYLIGGRVSDRVGRKKVIILSEIVSGIGFIFISYFSTMNHFLAIPVILLFSIIYFCQSAANPAYSALIIDVSNENDRKTIYIYFMWISNIAFALGSLLGGFFFADYVDLLFFLVGVTSFISAFASYFFIKDTTSIDHNKIVKQALKRDIVISKGRFRIIGVFASRIFFLLCIGKLLINLISEQFPNYLTIRIVTNYPVGNITGYNMIGYLNLEDTLITAFTAGIIIKITTRLSEKANLIIGLILFIVGYLCLSYFIHPLSLLFGMMLISIGTLIYLPTLQTVTSKIIPEESRGVHLSILGLMGALGGMLSGLFIWGMEYISEMGITYIFISIGICVVYIYSYAYRLINKENEKLLSDQYRNLKQANQ